MGLTVRPTAPEDWAAYRAIRLQALSDAPLAFASTYAREIAYADEVWIERVRSAPPWLARDTETGALVGTATGLPADRIDPAGDPGDEVLVAMFVVPQARGRRCAAALVAAVAGAARDRGARRLVLHVVESNTAARRAYARSGFRPTGRTMPLAHRPELTEIELALDLGSTAG